MLSRKETDRDFVTLINKVEKRNLEFREVGNIHQKRDQIQRSSQNIDLENTFAVLKIKRAQNG